MSLVGPNQRSCERCGTPFEPRSRLGASVQRFCCTACRLGFHKERLRRQRRACTLGGHSGLLPSYAGRMPARRARNRRRADEAADVIVSPGTSAATCCSGKARGLARRSRAFHLPRLLPAVPGNSRCAPRSDRWRPFARIGRDEPAEAHREFRAMGSAGWSGAMTDDL